MRDNDQLWRDLFWAQIMKNDRAGGRALSRGAVSLIAVVCAIFPTALLFPLADCWISKVPMPHLAFTEMAPNVLDSGIPLTALLMKFTGRWTGPHRFYGITFATIAAAVTRIAIYGASVIGDLNQAPQLTWIASHLIGTVTLTVAFIVVASSSSGTAPPPVKNQSSLSREGDLQYRDHSLYEKLKCYMQSSRFLRTSA